MAHNRALQEVRFANSARRHRIGKDHVLVALENAGEPTLVPAPSDDLDDRLVFVGVDDRGIELEIIGIQLSDFLYVIHVMPTEFRK